MDLLEKLNRQQIAAVTHQGGHQLVVAGAGTGKTRVLTHRIAWLIEQGLARPHEIMALTFTNKAAKEMSTRLEALIGPQAKMVTMGTFHAVCSRILRQHGDQIGIPRDFIVYDTYDQTSIIKQLLKSLGLDPKNVPPNSVLGKIDDFKNHGWTPDKATTEEFDIIGGYGLRLYEPYQKALRRGGALDFGDLLLECLELWKKHPDIANYYRLRYRYVLVDEFQDTNEVQLELLQQLAFGPNGSNIFAVGDDDQSIYSWRGANPANMANYESYFPGAAVYKLEENYRSTCGILDAANLLIEKNNLRRPKRLYSQDTSLEEPELIMAPGSEDEAAMVVGKILKQLDMGAAPGDFAIIMRTNAQSRPFEQMLRTADIPYTVVGGMVFFARQEVKDFLSALRLVFWPGSDTDFQRVLLRLTAGVGETTIDRLINLAKEEDCPLNLLVEKGAEYLQEHGFTKRAITPLIKLASTLSGLRAQSVGLPGQDFARLVFDQLQIAKTFLGDPQEEERQENIDEVLRLIAIREEEGTTLPAFLTQVSLEESSATQKQNGQGGAVTISTIHAAKGLEFPTVFLVGLEEGLLPHANALRSADHAGLGEGDKFIEEERRLCYVAVTRARKKLYLTMCGSRRSAKGGFYPVTISRFLEEMGIKAHPLTNRGYTPGYMSKHVHRRLHMGGHLDIDLEDDDEL